MKNIAKLLWIVWVVLLATFAGFGLRTVQAAPVADLARVPTVPCNVSGFISSDTTWGPATCDPYIVTGNVLVNSGVRLTIEPGVTVRFNAGKSLQINGELIAQGTSDTPITFTTNAGTWGYIHFTDTSVDAVYDVNGNYISGSIMEYAVVEYAGGAGVDNNGALRIENAHPLINRSTIRNNQASGIRAWSLSKELKISNSTISNNTASSGGGIYVDEGSTSISNCSITNNTVTSSGGGIYLGNPSTSAPNIRDGSFADIDRLTLPGALQI
jgi:parallel beta-helix repeat protein